MKKHLLTLCFAFLCAGFLMAATEVDSAWSATNTAVTKAKDTIEHCSCAATIDGKMNEEVWSRIAPVPIDRPMIHELPSLWSAYFKAFWNDTAIFVLGVAVDDNFWPSWKSGAADWASDKFETYFDANGTTTSTTYGASDAGAHGFYQVTHNYDTIPTMGLPHAGSFAGTIEANTWQLSSGLLKHDTLIVEWCVPFKVLKDSNGTAVTPVDNYTIGFDCDFVDLDSATAADRGRTRQMWSNTNAGGLGEDWGNMSDAGLITFSSCAPGSCVCGLKAGCEPPIQVSQISSLSPIITPSLASTFINVPTEVSRIEIINIMGCTVLQVSNDNGIVDISMLNKGIYYVRLFSNNDFLGNQEILKY